MYVSKQPNVQNTVQKTEAKSQPAMPLHAIHSLQQKIGNQSVQSMLKREGRTQSSMASAHRSIGVIQGVFIDKEEHCLPDKVWNTYITKSTSKPKASYITDLMNKHKIHQDHKNTVEKILKQAFGNEKDEEWEFQYNDNFSNVDNEAIMEWVEDELASILKKQQLTNTDMDRQESTKRKQTGVALDGETLGRRKKYQTGMKRTLSFNEALPRFIEHTDTAEKPKMSAMDGNATWAWGAYKVGDDYHLMGGNSSNDIRKDDEHNYHAEELIVEAFAEEIKQNNHGLNTSMTSKDGSVILILGISKTPCKDICQGKINKLLEDYPRLRIQFYFDKLYEGRSESQQIAELKAIQEFFEKWGIERVKWYPEYRTDIATVQQLRKKKKKDPYEGVPDDLFSELFGGMTTNKVKKISREQLNEEHIKELEKALGAYKGSFLA